MAISEEEKENIKRMANAHNMLQFVQEWRGTPGKRESGGFRWNGDGGEKRAVWLHSDGHVSFHDGSGKTFDVFDVIQKARGVEFPDAVRIAADAFGYVLECDKQNYTVEEWEQKRAEAEQKAAENVKNIQIEDEKEAKDKAETLKVFCDEYYKTLIENKNAEEFKSLIQHRNLESEIYSKSGLVGYIKDDLNFSLGDERYVIRLSRGSLAFFGLDLDCFKALPYEIDPVEWRDDPEGKAIRECYKKGGRWRSDNHTQDEEFKYTETPANFAFDTGFLPDHRQDIIIFTESEIDAVQLQIWTGCRVICAPSGAICDKLLKENPNYIYIGLFDLDKPKDDGTITAGDKKTNTAKEKFGARFFDFRTVFFDGNDIQDVGDFFRFYKRPDFEGAFLPELNKALETVKQAEQAQAEQAQAEQAKAETFNNLRKKMNDELFNSDFCTKLAKLFGVESATDAGFAYSKLLVLPVVNAYSREIGTNGCDDDDDDNFNKNVDKNTAYPARCFEWVLAEPGEGKSAAKTTICDILNSTLGENVYTQSPKTGAAARQCIVRCGTTREQRKDEKGKTVISYATKKPVPFVWIDEEAGYKLMSQNKNKNSGGGEEITGVKLQFLNDQFNPYETALQVDEGLPSSIPQRPHLLSVSTKSQFLKAVDFGEDDGNGMAGRLFVYVQPPQPESKDANGYMTKKRPLELTENRKQQAINTVRQLKNTYSANGDNCVFKIDFRRVDVWQAVSDCLNLRYNLYNSPGTNEQSFMRMLKITAVIISAVRYGLNPQTGLNITGAEIYAAAALVFGNYDIKRELRADSLTTKAQSCLGSEDLILNSIIESIKNSKHKHITEQQIKRDFPTRGIEVVEKAIKNRVLVKSKFVYTCKPDGVTVYKMAE